MRNKTLAEELTQLYDIPREISSKITANYLKLFRKCPDNPTYDLHTWRSSLWTKVLTEKYSHLTEKIYERWLYLRYQYLNLSPDTVAMLLELRKTYSLGLITNGPSRAQWEKVRRLNLSRYFDNVLVSGDFPWEKPEPKIFHEACRSLGVLPSNCIMIGDKLETDIKGGIQTGLAGTIWMPLSEIHSYSEIDPKPDFMIKCITDILGILDAESDTSKLSNTSTNQANESPSEKVNPHY